MSVGNKAVQLFETLLLKPGSGHVAPAPTRHNSDPSHIQNKIISWLWTSCLDYLKKNVELKADVNEIM